MLEPFVLASPPPLPQTSSLSRLIKGYESRGFRLRKSSKFVQLVNFSTGENIQLNNRMMRKDSKKKKKKENEWKNLG